MNTLPDHFYELLHHIEPDADRIELAKEYPSKVRNFLKSSEILHTEDPFSRLAGSYARGTAISNIKDVDILLFVSQDYKEKVSSGAEQVLRDLYSVLRKLPDALEIEGHLDPEAVALRKQRRSINVHLEGIGCYFDLDIVPVTAPNGVDDVLYIPDRDWSKWVETQPLGYSLALSKLNRENGGKVVRLIKLFKHWRDVQMNILRPKSYWLECLIYNLVSKMVIKTDGKSYAELSYDILNAINIEFTPYLNTKDKVPPISDPMLKNNVAWNWERSAFETFMRRVEESLKWASRALEEEQEQAINLWKKVFGNDFFPSNLENSLSTYSRAALTGSLHTSPNGLIGITVEKNPSLPIPQHKFYGEDEN